MRLFKKNPLRNAIVLLFTLAICIYLAVGLFANTARGYYPEIILMFIPEYGHDRMLFRVYFLELFNFWMALIVVVVIVIAWRHKLKPF